MMANDNRIETGMEAIYRKFDQLLIEIGDERERIGMAGDKETALRRIESQLLYLKATLRMFEVNDFNEFTVLKIKD